MNDYPAEDRSFVNALRMALGLDPLYVTLVGEDVDTCQLWPDFDSDDPTEDPPQDFSRVFMMLRFQKRTR